MGNRNEEIMPSYIIKWSSAHSAMYVRMLKNDLYIENERDARKVLKEESLSLYNNIYNTLINWI